MRPSVSSRAAGLAWLTMLVLALAACNLTDTGGGGGAPPEAPTGVTVTAGNGQVTLSWNAVAGATSYNIYWANSSGVTKLAGNLIAGTVSPYSHTGLTNGTAYYYVVTALNDDGESVESLEVGATPLPPIPNAPTGVSVTGGNGQVTISWSAVTGATGYNIYFGTASGVTKSSGTKIAGVTSPYIHGGRTNGTAYYYVVTAVNSGGESSESAQVTATPLAPPAAPTGVAATGGNAQVTISWNAVSGAASYNIYFATATGVTKSSGTKIAGVTSPYLHGGITNGTTYYYVLTAVNSGGESAESAQVSAMPLVSASAAPYTTTSVISLGTSSFSGQILTANVPTNALSIGIVSFGTNNNKKVVDHGAFLRDTNNNLVYIRDPDGNLAPLSFSLLNGQLTKGDLRNEQAASVFFPNNGENRTLKAGNWIFPVGSYNAADTALEADTMTTYVYYKTQTSQVPTLKLNVFVMNGVSGAITSTTQAQNNAEIQGAVQVLRNVYQSNSAIAVNVAINVQFVNDTTCLTTTPGVVASQAQEFCLLKTYPATPTHDAMNIFVISALGYLPQGVIGLSAGIPGSFNRQGLAVSGTLAEYQGDGTGTILGFIFAHEFGHFLGLYHTSQPSTDLKQIIGEDPIADTPLCTTAQVSASLSNCPDRNNLMFPVVSTNANPPISVGQGNVVKYNPAITVP